MKMVNFFLFNTLYRTPNNCGVLVIFQAFAIVFMLAPAALCLSADQIVVRGVVNGSTELSLPQRERFPIESSSRRLLAANAGVSSDGQGQRAKGFTIGFAELADRKLFSSRAQGGSLRFRLVHRHHPDSPVHPMFKPSNAADSLTDSVKMDKVRLMEFENRRVNSKRNSRNLSEQGSQTYDSTYTFETPVVSGSSSGSGQYFVDFYFGTPPQKFSLIVDTGSDLIWVQCEPCIACYSQLGPLFHPGDSSTYCPLNCASSECQLIPSPLNFTCNFKRPGVCGYAYGYADQSETQGVFATETATMNVSNGSTVQLGKLAFGCGNFNVGPSFKGAGGVVGLGRGPVSFASQVGNVFGNMFSYCLVNYLDKQSISSTLYFGDEGMRSTKARMQFTPFVKNPLDATFYYVGIVSVSVGGDELPIPSQLWGINRLGYGGTVVDSGTTLTVFLEPAYLIILNAFQQAICYPRVVSIQGLDLCFDTTGVSDPRLPSFSMRLYGNVVFRPPTSNIFVQTGPNTMCLAMAGSTSPFGSNVLGNLLQQNFQVVYDLAGQRFGFAPAKCSST